MIGCPKLCTSLPIAASQLAQDVVPLSPQSLAVLLPMSTIDGVRFQLGPACHGSISMYGVAPAASAWLMNAVGQS